MTEDWFNVIIACSSVCGLVVRATEFEPSFCVVCWCAHRRANNSNSVCAYEGTVNLTKLGRRGLVFAVACLLVISLTVALIVNPTIQTKREDVSALEPVVASAFWIWIGVVNFELDIQPLTKTVITSSFPQLGFLSGGIHSDVNIPEPRRELIHMPRGGLQSLGYIGGKYYKDGVLFSEGMTLVSSEYLNHKPQNVTTALSIYVASNSDINALVSGHLVFFLNGTILQDSEFVLPYTDTGAYAMYLGFKDLTNSTLTLLWTGATTIHVFGQTIIMFSAQSADFTLGLPIAESCVVERHFSNYLRLGYPKLHDCVFRGYKELPPANQTTALSMAV